MSDQTVANERHRPHPTGDTPIEWFYVYRGERKGPVAAQEIKRLMDSGVLKPNDEIWRKGMSEWVAIRSSELGEMFGTVPPPISSKNVSNGLVWFVALLPLVFGLFDLYLAHLPAQTFLDGFELALVRAFPDRQGPWSIEVIASAFLCVWDESNVKKAGYGSKWMTTWAFFVFPVYLFLRAKTLKQWPTYAIAWIIVSIAAAILPVS